VMAARTWVQGLDLQRQASQGKRSDLQDKANAKDLTFKAKAKDLSSRPGPRT